MSLIDQTEQASQSAPSATDLAAIARSLRYEVAKMIIRNGHGYLQQGLGAADLFTALFFSELRLKPDNPTWPERDRFILSTAHNSAVFYATLALRGLIDHKQLESYCQDGSPLEINVSERLPYHVETTCGSLGQGLSVGIGLALSAQRQGYQNRICVLLGDGELQEGQVWEAAMAAAHHQLARLCLIIDMNDMQVEGSTSKVTTMPDMRDKWQAFGWHVIDIDGNNISACLEAFEEARHVNDRPTVVLAKTLVGKGVPFLEGQKNHTVRLAAGADEAILQALSEPAS